MSKLSGEHLEKIIADCVLQKSKAQYKLFKHYYGMMMNICLRYASCYEDAQDILSEGFMKIFQHLPDYRSEGSFEAWMKTIVTHTALDYLRKYNSIQKFEYKDMSDIMDDSLYSGVENNALAKIAYQDILKLIQQLPNMSRTVFNMYAIDGYSHAEIAQILGMKEGTSHWHLNYARKTLQEMIKKCV